MGNQRVREMPTKAYIASLVGGIFGVLASSLYTLLMADAIYYLGDYDSSYALILGLGIWMIIASILVIVFAVKLNANPEDHSLWGVLILIFSFISIAGILACVGGILALVYKPKPVVYIPPPPPRPQPPYYPPQQVPTQSSSQSAPAKTSPTPPKPLPAQLRISADPLTIVADGTSKSTLTLQLLDREDKPAAATADVVVKMLASKGKLAKPTITIRSGTDVAKTFITASTERGSALVSASAVGLRNDEVALNFKEEELHCLYCGSVTPSLYEPCPECGRIPP